MISFRKLSLIGLTTKMIHCILVSPQSLEPVAFLGLMILVLAPASSWFIGSEHENTADKRRIIISTSLRKQTESPESFEFTECLPKRLIWYSVLMNSHFNICANYITLVLTSKLILCNIKSLSAGTSKGFVQKRLCS